MIESVGFDLIEVKRIEDAVKRRGNKFLKRVYTEKEISYCFGKKEAYRSLAGRFAAKEAVFKVTGLGKRGKIRWTDVEVLNDKYGKPTVRLQGEVREIIGIREVLISISHTSQHAAATALLKSG